MNVHKTQHWPVCAPAQMEADAPPWPTDVVPTGQAVQLGLGFLELPPPLYVPTGHVAQPLPDTGVEPMPRAQTVTADTSKGCAYAVALS